MLYTNMQKKEACRFFKWLDKRTCARGIKIFAELTTKVKDLENENDRRMARIKTWRMKMTVVWKGLSTCKREMIITWKSLSI